MKRMAVQYNRLWKLLIDKKMKKSALTELADVSSSTIAKLNRRFWSGSAGRSAVTSGM